ncbi:hypothetical protein ACTXT7_017167 [Hymenolepis weldensis]
MSKRRLQKSDVDVKLKDLTIENFYLEDIDSPPVDHLPFSALNLAINTQRSSVCLFDRMSLLIILEGIRHRFRNTKVTLERIWSHMDVFAFGHFFGWVIKAILLRHYLILWTLSINWEITEIAFSHILPNFQECWWDSLFLDVLLCNGLGIFCGMLLCQWFHARSYQWESIRDIPSKRGKLKRAVLQFTPVSFLILKLLHIVAIRFMKNLCACEFPLLLAGISFYLIRLLDFSALFQNYATPDLKYINS